jgi:crotonobetainyl-CoA:carnitine CoA-transferase CaiB-like acyl-CoA transferase
MSSALDGLRVLDLTNVLAGPLCTYQLALLGAQVIKVEAPAGGDLARQLGSDPELNSRLMGASFLAQNGGKQSLTVNLKRPEGREVLRRLVARSDVLVENFRPGVMARLGLSYDDLLAVNPSLVYCAISGFGQQGPLREAPAYDQIIQGQSGMMSITGDEQCAPLRAGYPVADTVSGITAAFAIAAALLRRQRTGEGGFVDVSMLDSALVAMGWVVSNFLIAGTEPVPHGNSNFTASPSGTFRTGDGLINIAANKQEQFEALANKLGRPDLVCDPRFAGRESRKTHRAELTAELESALAARPASEWEPLLNDVDVPAGRVVTVPQALASPQLALRSLLQTFGDTSGIGRDVTVLRTGFKLTDGDPQAALPPPGLGEHTQAILGELGYSEADIQGMKQAGIV